MKNYTLFLLLFLTQIGFSQDKEIIIKFTADDFPQDITWELQNQVYNGIVAQGSLGDEGCLPFQECTVLDMLIPDGCYTLLVRDRNGDGLPIGSYEVFFGGELMVTQEEEFEERIYTNFNCGPGETCEDAIVLTLPDRNIYAPDTKEYWFQFTPQDTGKFRINTCDNRQTGIGWADTELWIYDSCNRDIHNRGAEGALNYSDDEAECAPGAGFNFIDLYGGQTYYIRHNPQQDWINILFNDSLKIKFQQLPVRPGCMDPDACNYDPFADVPGNIVCEYDGSCQPDLSLDVDELRATIQADTVFSNDNCFIVEGCLRGPGPREVIRFSTKIDNIGDADYVVGRPEGSPELFSQDNCHGHFHHLGYAEYLLYTGVGQPTPVGFKSGFCVLDLDCSNAGVLPKYICANMGITKGCSDIYDEHIDCQWIDITDIDDGEYSIIVRVNQFELPDARGLAEKTFENNSGQVCVNIDRSSGQLIVTVLDDCTPFVDCAGTPNGDAVADCEGVCGGKAHFGDLDDTGELEENDLDLYVDMLKERVFSDSPCFDLNGDGQLSIFDAALIDECIVEKIDNEDNPFHTHCSFPNGSDNAGEFATLRIGEFNTSENFLEIEGWFPDRDVVAYQVTMGGIDITEVERLYATEATQYGNNKESVFVMHTDEAFERNTGFAPLLRIHFEALNTDSICIMGMSEVVSTQYDRLTLNLVDNCQFISSTVNADPLTQSRVTVLPNPVKNKLSVLSDDLALLKYEIFGLNGSKFMENDLGATTVFDISVTDLPSGVYILKLFTQDGQIVSKRITKI